MSTQANPFAQFDLQPIEQDQKEDPFAQFDLQPVEPLTKVEGVGRQVIKGAKELGSGLLGLPGDVINLFDMVATGIEGAALEGALFLGEKAGLSPETSEQIRSKRQEVVDFKAQQFKLPGTEQLQQASDVGIQDLAAKLGYDLDVSPQDATERVSRRGLEFLSTAPVFGAGKIASVGAGVGSQIAEELGFGAVGQVSGALAGGGLAGLGRGVVKGGLTPIQSAKSATAKGLAKTSGLKPSQIKTELIEAAVKEGIDLPVVAKVDNALIKSLYTKSFQSGLTGDALKQQVKNTTEKIVENIKKVPEQLGGRARESRQILGAEIQEASKEFVKTRRQEIGRLYDTARSGAEGLTVNGDNVFKVIQRTKKDLERTLVQGAEKKQTIGALDAALKNIQTEREVARSLSRGNIQEIKSLVSDKFGVIRDGTKQGAAFKRINKALSAENAKSADIAKSLETSIKELGTSFASEENKALADSLRQIRKDLTITRKIPGKDIKIPVNTVVETMKDINDIVKFENFGGTNKLLLRLKGELDQTLKPFKKDTLFGNALERANKEFGELAQVFESDKKMANLLKNPEAKGLVRLAESPEGLERLLKTLPPGESALKNDLKRTLLEDAIIKPLINKDGVIDLGRVKNVLSNKDSARLVKHIVGAEQFKKLQSSQKFAKEAFLGLEEFINRSQSGVTGLDVAGISSAVSGVMGSVATMNPAPAIVGISPLAGATLFSATIKDPKMIDLIIEMGKANKFQGTEKFMEAMKRPLAEFTRRLGQIAVNEGISLEDLGIKEEEE
ncbi:hypothetical protein OAF54_02075 [bacterium]|nr:hypothetical protein [bacterium]